MTERIVVCLSEPPSRTALASSGSFIVRARELMLRAKAFGATLCTWSVDSLSFGFQVDDLEEAVGFVTGPDTRDLARAFGVGIVRGTLDLLTSDAEIEPGWGPVVRQALDLAQVAKPGEVLIERETLATCHVRLVTRGSRTTSGTPPVRAYSIDVDSPLRAQADQDDRLTEPSLQGRDGVLATLHIPAGTLATVRAAPGLGATRLLRALAERDKRAPCLWVVPAGHRMEPLGALRRAFTRAQALGVAPRLPGACDQTLRKIAEGLGAPPAAVAELLERWMAHPAGKGLVLIDDVHDVDDATLEVVAAALLGSKTPFRVVARLDRDSPLPAELAPLPPGPEVDLAPLADGDAAKLVLAWTGNAMTTAEAATWASHAGGNPLALGEVLAEALATGTLVAGREGARPRSIPPPAPNVSSPEVAIAKRLRFLTPGTRATLFALAVLGGDAPSQHIARVIELCADIPVDLELEQERLSQNGWIRSPQPGWLSLLSRTQLRVIGHAIPETNRAAWHRAASTVAESVGHLHLAEAAWHAATSNDRARAQRLAQLAAAIAETAGLESASRDLHAFARAHDPSPRPRIESDPSGLIPRLPMASSPGSPEDIFPVALAARGPKRPSRFTFPPVAISDAGALADSNATDGSVPPSGEILGPDDIRKSLPDIDAAPKLAPPPPRRPTPPGTVRRPVLELVEDQEPLETHARPAYRDSMGSIHELTADDAIALRLVPIDDEDPSSERTIAEAAPPQDAPVTDESGSGIVRVLREGSAEDVEAWVEQGTGSSRLVERVRALAELRRGKHAEAVRVLRNACEQARSLSVVERARSHLAFAVGLAQAARPLEALIEGIEALARAREAGDIKAEDACLTFLRILYEEQNSNNASGWRPRQVR
jgi:hypothetical protein